MNIGSQALVVGKVPSGMVGIVVDNDVVRIPVPIIAVAEIIQSHTKEEAAESKARRAAATQASYMAGAGASRKMTMLKGMVEMIVRIVAAGIVADPLTIFVNMERVRVTGRIVEVTIRLNIRRPVKLGMPMCGSGVSSYAAALR